jgi:transcriptional regulator with XRE-family HTH domain
MPKKPHHLPPKTKRALAALGQQIQAARLKRNLTMELICQRAGISSPTLRSIEQGQPTPSVGSLAMVLLALGLQDDLKKIAGVDEVGELIQESELRKRASRPRKQSKKTDADDQVAK